MRLKIRIWYSGFCEMLQFYQTLTYLTSNCKIRFCLSTFLDKNFLLSSTAYVYSDSTSTDGRRLLQHASIRLRFVQVSSFTSRIFLISHYTLSRLSFEHLFRPFFYYLAVVIPILSFYYQLISPTYSIYFLSS